MVRWTKVLRLQLVSTHFCPHHPPLLVQCLLSQQPRRAEGLRNLWQQLGTASSGDVGSTCHKAHWDTGRHRASAGCRHPDGLWGSAPGRGHPWGASGPRGAVLCQLLPRAESSQARGHPTGHTVRVELRGVLQAGMPQALSPVV